MAVVNAWSVLRTFFIFGLMSQQVSSNVVKRSTACYTGLGCFSSAAPFFSPQRPLSAAPDSPDSIKTQFILYTRATKLNGQTLDARHPDQVKARWTSFADRKTQFIVHGFLDNPNINHWLRDMKNELLTHGDYNTIIVDWHHGNLPPYTQATANTRVVGAQIAVLIKQLQNDFDIHGSKFHIIGHSLGAHIAGYAGERVPGLGRITGLDPAGPYFEGTDKVVRLDPTDADFVDAIHSDGESLLQLGFGLKQHVGHLDFYPNLGHDQPGCEMDPVGNILDLGIVDGAGEIAACNHLRAIKFFSESINSKCPFMSYPCASEDDFKGGKCHSCPSGGCASMGFRADEHKPASGTNIKYYTTTADDTPFCQFHIDVKIKFGTGSLASRENGDVKVVMHGDKGTSNWITLNKSPMTYQPGRSYEFMVGVPVDFGTIKSLEFQWHHKATLTNPLKWNVFNLRHPTMVLEEIDVIREEAGVEVHYCSSGSGAVETDHTLNVMKPC